MRRSTAAVLVVAAALTAGAWLLRREPRVEEAPRKTLVQAVAAPPEPVKIAPLIFAFPVSKTLIACVKAESAAIPESASPVSGTTENVPAACAVQAARTSARHDRPKWRNISKPNTRQTFVKTTIARLLAKARPVRGATPQAGRAFRRRIGRH